MRGRRPDRKMEMEKERWETRDDILMRRNRDEGMVMGD